MARADLITSTILVLFGGAVVFESWRMPRFESIGGTFHNAPGLVPGLLGAIIALMGALMLVRSLRAMAGRATSAAPTASERFGGAQSSAAPADSAAIGARSGADAGLEAGIGAGPELGADIEGDSVPTEPEPAAHGYRRLAWILGLSLVYAAGMVGRMPFWLATFLYVFVAIVVFERPDYTTPRRTTIRIVIAAVIAGATAWAVPFVFEKIFLVNLP